MLAEQNCRKVLAEARDVVAGVEDALVLAAAADGDKGHLGIYQLAERAAKVAIVPGRNLHVTTALVAARAQRYLPGRRGRAFAELAGGVEGVYQR